MRNQTPGDDRDINLRVESIDDIRLGHHDTGIPASVMAREWLITNGLGSFASGTVGGLRTRRYHSLLTAALRPPADRTVVAAALAETAIVGERAYPLFAAQWQAAHQPIEPTGFSHIERFRLDGSVPEWTFALGASRLTKRIWMEQGANVTFVRYENTRGDLWIDLAADVFVEHRGFHDTTRAGDWIMAVEPAPGGVALTAFAGASPVQVTCEGAQVEPSHVWYRNEYLAAEDARGLDAVTDRLRVATFTVHLAPGDSATLTIAADADAAPSPDGSLARRRDRDRSLLVDHEDKPAWIRRLILAADQFIVSRTLGDSVGTSVIAGYPWFGDWGRDTMIALPGLTLVTGRHDMAADVLSTYAEFVDEGMLPNRFPDLGEQPEYNTVDATLWYFDAVRRYYTATGDDELVGRLYPVLREIVEWHIRGTRHGIGIDPGDGLLRSGEPGVQLTWMDAKVDDWVVTPRTGKTVEVNALWYHALRTMEELAAILTEDAAYYGAAADQVRASFDRFWNEQTGYCFDVIDGPAGGDPSLRPNQIVAVALAHSPLPIEQCRAVVYACERHLFTPLGIRTLGPDDPGYIGRYGGSRERRDAAYHQGTAWPWLLGPFVTAHHRVFGDTRRALSYLDAIEAHLSHAGLGTVSEVVDGNPPHTPGGAIAQAWSVAEVLRAWHELAGSAQ